MTCASTTLVMCPVLEVIKMQPKVMVGKLACFICMLLSLMIGNLSFLQVCSITDVIVDPVPKMA